MWKSTLISILFLVSPFLVCDPDPDVKSYILTNKGKLIGQIPAQKDGSLKYDVAGLEDGLHRFMIIFCTQYECKVTGVYFEFTRPYDIKFLNPPPRREK